MSVNWRESRAGRCWRSTLKSWKKNRFEIILSSCSSFLLSLLPSLLTDFSLIVAGSYELFDEVMDFGYPQTTESKILQEYITQESHKLEVQVRPPMAVTNAVSWRSEGIRYRKNEVFLDVVESVNLLVSSLSLCINSSEVRRLMHCGMGQQVNANGNVVRSEILGAVKMKCYLSGMPELRLGLNDKVMFESTGRSQFISSLPSLLLVY